MKRSTIIAAALCLSLFSLSGCAQQQEEPAQQPHPPQEQIEAPAPAPSQQPAPAQGEQAVADPEPTPAPIHPIPTGVWLAETDVGYSNYYYFNAEEQNGSYRSLDYGLGMDFNYEGSGDELVFLMGDEANAHYAHIEHAEGDSFTLVWENNLSETLEFVSQSTLEDFPFYSNDELIRLSTAFYARNGSTPPELSAAITNEDNTVTVQLYDNLGDHNSTSAWYILDRFTATGTDLLNGKQVDLLEHSAPADGEEESPVEEDIPVEGEVIPDEAGQLPETGETAAEVEPLPENGDSSAEVEQLPEDGDFPAEDAETQE